MNPNQSPSGTHGLHDFADWVRRSCGAMLADLKLVDSGSLDVLLYCADDLAMPGRGGLEVDRLGR